MRALAQRVVKAARSSLREPAAWWALRVACDRRWAWLAALAWQALTAPLPVGDSDVDAARAAQSRRRDRIVVLHKTGGTEDVVAAAEGRIPANLALVMLPRNAVRTAFRTVLDPEFRTLMDMDYRTGDVEVEPAKLRYRSFLREVVTIYARRTRVTGFVTANLSFRAERELAAACEELDVVFLAIHKESIRTAAQRTWFERAYRELIGPFGGRAIGVYNDEERDCIVAAGLAGPSDVTVVGCARMDVLHQRRLDQQLLGSGGRSTGGPIVLFAVDVQAGTWTPYDGRESTGAPRWDRLAALTEEAFFAAASAHPEREFVVKTKIGREAQQEGRLPEVLPDNVRIVSGGLGTELLLRASLAVGFNSTVLLEALAAGIPVLVPDFAEAAQPEAAGWKFDLGGAAVMADSPEQLVRSIAAALTADGDRGGGPEDGSAGRDGELSAGAIAALERYVGNTDGESGRRAWELMARLLERPSLDGPRAS